MTTTPSAILNILDGGLGVSSTSALAIAVVGTSSSGTNNEVFISSDADLIKSHFGQGVMVDFAAMLASIGVTVVCGKAETTTPGAAGSVTTTREDSSDGTLSVSGAAYDAYEAIVEILTDADDTASAEGTFRYSLDDGDSYSAPIQIPSGQINDTVVSAGTSPPTLTPSGTPDDAYRFRVEITTLGAPGTAVFRWSKDGGTSWEKSSVTVPTTPFQYGLATAITAAGTTPPTCTADGVADDHYDFQIEITTGGSPGTAEFRWSLDGGTTWEASGVTVPTTPFEYALGTTGVTITFGNASYATDNVYTWKSLNVTLTFENGTYAVDNVYTWNTASQYTIPDSGLTIRFINGAGTELAFEDGDLFAFDCSAPGYSTSALGTAIDAVVANNQRWRCLCAPGEAATAAASAAQASTLDTKMSVAEAAHRYTYAMMGCADDTDAALQVAFENFTSSRVAVCAGFENFASFVHSGRYYKRSALWAAALRVAQIALSKDPGDVKLGPLTGLTARISGDTTESALYRDERVTPGLNASGFLTLTTIDGQKGYFVTRGNIKCAEGSDFHRIPLRQVMDVACETLYPALASYMNHDVRTDADGTIHKAEANRIDQEFTELLADVLWRTEPQHVSSKPRAWVRRDTNIQSTGKMIAKFRIQPKGYLDEIEGEVAFTATVEE